MHCGDARRGSTPSTRSDPNAFTSRTCLVGLGYDLVAVEQPITTVELLKHDEANDAQAGRLMRHARFVPTVEGWQNMDIRGEQNLFVMVKLETQVPY